MSNTHFFVSFVLTVTGYNTHCNIFLHKHLQRDWKKEYAHNAVFFRASIEGYTWKKSWGQQIKCCIRFKHLLTTRKWPLPSVFLTDRMATLTLAYLHIMNLNALLLLHLHFVAGHSSWLTAFSYISFCCLLMQWFPGN